jgi:uncharacterized membrane protein YfcA
MHLAPEVFATLVAVAGVAGFIDAIAGGGGLLTLPSLLAAGLPPVAALATSKLQSSLGTATAVATYGRTGLIDLRGLAWPAAAALIGAALGALTVQHIDPSFLSGLVPLLLIGISAYFLFAPRVSEAERPARLKARAYGLVAFGIGFYDGFFGPGAGAFYVISLVTLMGLGLVKGTANTKLLNLASNIGALILMAFGGHIIWPLGLAMAAAGMAGGFIGSHTALRFGPRLIRPLLVVVSLALTVKLLLQPGNPVARLLWPH